MKVIEHLKTITHHRHLVRQHCFQVGLYWQGLTHDLSKFSPTEFLVGAKYFQGDRSPNNAEREAKGYSSSWLHHKGRNKHHFEYWIDYSRTQERLLGGMKMPVRFVVEMFMDRIAACKTYQKDEYTDGSPWEYHKKSRLVHEIMHEESLRLLEHFLQMLGECGEDATFSYVKRFLKQERKRAVRQFFGICLRGGNRKSES
ncbi:MAG: catalase [Clostridia bacterium]|nr:catalase [Clostridia bacterium]